MFRSTQNDEIWSNFVIDNPFGLEYLIKWNLFEMVGALLTNFFIIMIIIFHKELTIILFSIFHRQSRLGYENRFSAHQIQIIFTYFRNFFSIKY